MIKRSDLANQVMETICRKETMLRDHFYSMVFILFKETFNFTVFTNFQDQGWTNMLIWFCISGNIFKNICEMNNLYFKEI